MIKWTIPLKDHGILVAADEKIEWLLPWWWDRVHQQGNLPIAFVDLGMSHYGKTFCKERGYYIPLNLEKDLSKVPEKASSWETIFGKGLWENRRSWFKKPFALLLSPFKQTLWLDLDCEVIKPLDPLFDLEGEIFLAKETPQSHARERELKTIYENEILYNSGVILYAHGSKIIEDWGIEILQKGDQFWSDQHVLSRMIYQKNYPVASLHEDYNWRMSQGLNFHAKIVHWVGSWGKEYIRKYGGIGEELAALPPI